MRRGRNYWSQERLPITGPIYRLPERGVVKGVCAGVAEYLGVAPNLVRLIYVIALLAAGFFPLVLAYPVLVYILPVRRSARESRPLSPYHGRVRYQEPATKRQVSQHLVQLEQRLGRLESYLVSREYEWEKSYRGR